MKKRLALVIVLVLALVSVLAVNVSASSKTTYVAHLSGNTGAQGQVIFHVSPDGSSVDYKLIVANIDNVTVAHIHQTSTGGRPVVWLFPSVDARAGQLVPGRSNGVLVTGTFEPSDFVGTQSGNTMEQFLAALEAGDLYVNVHTLANPGGEISGTIH